jgi:hypothetical protein
MTGLPRRNPLAERETPRHAPQVIENQNQAIWHCVICMLRMGDGIYARSTEKGAREHVSAFFWLDSRLHGLSDNPPFSMALF